MWSCSVNGRGWLLLLVMGKKLAGKGQMQSIETERKKRYWKTSEARGKSHRSRDMGVRNMEKQRRQQETEMTGEGGQGGITLLVSCSKNSPDDICLRVFKLVLLWVCVCVSMFVYVHVCAWREGEWVSDWLGPTTRLIYCILFTKVQKLQFPRLMTQDLSEWVSEWGLVYI